MITVNAEVSGCLHVRAATDFDGTERAPMQMAEARITLGVVSARQGDIERAVHYGERALTNQRKSLPSLVMVSRDLTRVLKERFPREQATTSYLDQLHAISTGDLARHGCRVPGEARHFRAR